jgi:hypothetical protein
MKNLLSTKKALRILLLPALIFGLGIGGYAFTASNTVPATKAGDGAGAISGFTLSNVKYTLNSTNARNIDAVAFDVDVAPAVGATMTIKLVAAGSTWYTCTNAATAITCNTTSPQATVLSADELRVLIVN